jgi:hypothetical protein
MPTQGDPGQQFWNYYVTLKPNDVLYLTNPHSPGYDSVFAGNLWWCMSNLAYGFADYGGATAGPHNGNNKYIGRFGGG